MAKTPQQSPDVFGDDTWGNAVGRRNPACDEAVSSESCSGSVREGYGTDKSFGQTGF